LSFFDLIAIDSEIARELAKFKGYTLEFGLFGAITPEIARELAKFQGDTLVLPGLNPGITSDNPEVFEEIYKFKGTVITNFY
jgi:hypothetical protein